MQGQFSLPFSSPMLAGGPAIRRLVPGDLGARTGNARALELLARLVAHDERFPPTWTAQIVEAHRRILGNASANLALDALFATLLTRKP